MTPVPLSFAALRALFPALDRCLYLNNARAGLSFAAQGEAAARFYADKAGGIAGNDRWLAVAEDVRARLGRLLQVPATEIDFVGSATEALNLLAGSLPLGPGDEIVVAEGEYPSVLLPWQRQGRGAAVRQVAIAGERERTEALAAAVGPATRVLCVSHVHNRTGTRVDLDRLADACAAHGAFLIVDGFQAVGAVAVDARRADAYCSSVYKRLLSGYGLGFVRVSPRLAQAIDPVFRGYYNPGDSRLLQYGTIDYPGLYALQAALRLGDAFGWEAQFARIDALCRRLADGLAAFGVDAVGAGGPAGIVSVPHPDPLAAQRTCLAQELHLEPWDNGLLRLSPHVYNDEGDIDRALMILRGIYAARP